MPTIASRLSNLTRRFTAPLDDMYSALDEHVMSLTEDAVDGPAVTTPLHRGMVRSRGAA